MFGISRFWLRRYSLMLIINSVLSGLVGITASCAVIEPWAAVVVGVVAALAYTASSRLLVRLHIDDPLDAAAVHAASGFWGLLTSVAAQARAEGGGEALPGEHNTPHGPPHLASPHSPGLFATPTGIKESFGLSSVLHYGLLVGVRCGQHSFPPRHPLNPTCPPCPEMRRAAGSTSGSRSSAPSASRRGRWSPAALYLLSCTRRTRCVWTRTRRWPVRLPGPRFLWPLSLALTARHWAGLDTLKHGTQAYAEFQLTHA